MFKSEHAISIKQPAKHEQLSTGYTYINPPQRIDGENGILSHVRTSVCNFATDNPKQRRAPDALLSTLANGIQVLGRISGFSFRWNGARTKGLVIHS